MLVVGKGIVTGNGGGNNQYLGAVDASRRRLTHDGLPLSALGAPPSTGAAAAATASNTAAVASTKRPMWPTSGNSCVAQIVVLKGSRQIAPPRKPTPP